MLMFYEEYHNCFYDILFDNALKTRNHAIISFMSSILISFTLRAWIFGSYPATLDSTILFWPLVKHSLYGCFNFNYLLAINKFSFMDFIGAVDPGPQLNGSVYYNPSLYWSLLAACKLHEWVMINFVWLTFIVSELVVLHDLSNIFLRVVLQKVGVCNWKLSRQL